MITETGRVVAVEQDCLWVETIRRSSCDSCSAQKACGHGLMNKLDESLVHSKNRHYVRALLGGCPAERFQLDDEVEISIPEKVLVQGALVVYLLPLVTLLLGAVLASSLREGDVAAVLGAGCGFLVGFAMVRLHALLTRDNTDLQPVVNYPQGSMVEAIELS